MGAPGSALKPGSVQTGVGVKVGGALRPEGRPRSLREAGMPSSASFLPAGTGGTHRGLCLNRAQTPRLEGRQETVKVMSPGLEPSQSLAT